MNQRTTYVPVKGGMDLVTPAIAINAGKVLSALNYMPTDRGYQRIDGHERFDGRPKPSDASYWVLNFDAGSAAISAGNIVTDGTSGATGEALIDAVVSTGTYGGNNAAGYLILVNLVGTFGDGNDLEVSAAKKSEANGTTTNRGATNDTNDDLWLQDAIETTRADIGTVTGSGIMRGIWYYNGAAYAFRDNAGASAVDMYKSTTAGWVKQSLGFKLAFTSGGTYVVAIGDTITGNTSSRTATVTGVTIHTGTLAAGDATGYITYLTSSGAFQSETLNVGGNVNVATIAANGVAITFAVAGKHRFRNKNFVGATNQKRMYGVDGVSEGYQWDGTTLVPIKTGMTTDTPKHIAAYKNHLFYSFAGGSVQHSGIGDPYAWSVVLGAGEIGLGDEVTGMLEDVSGVMTLYTRNSVSNLYGNASLDWDLRSISDDAGCIEDSAQKIGSPIYMDDRGLRDQRTTQKYGDFLIGTISQMISPLLEAKKKAGVTVTASVRVRQKDQYRIFFSDMSGLCVYFGRGHAEILPFNLGLVIHTVCSAEDSSGNEILLAGSTDGYIYELDAGTSFDGSEVEAWIRFPFNHIGTPTQNKRFHRLSMEMDAGDGVSLSTVAEFDYAGEYQPAAHELDFTVVGGGGFWDEDNWEAFNWDSAVHGVADVHLDGQGVNMSVAIISLATYEEPHTLHGMTIHYSYRGLKR
jgi:hypothetical protein